MFLGEDLLPLLVLALGAAMVVGNGLALLRPPPDAQGGGARARAGRPQPGDGRRSGLLAGIWALASLLSG